MSPPHRLDRLGDLDRGATLGALEQQVLEEVARAGERRRARRATPVPTQKPTAAERSAGSDSVTTRSPESSRVRRMPVIEHVIGADARSTLDP